MVPVIAGPVVLLTSRNAPAAGPEIGAVAPAFTLKNVDGTEKSLADYADSKAVVVVFTCNHCPFAQKYEPRLITMQNDYAERGVRFVLINSNDPVKQPLDSYAEMKKRATAKSYPFPYLWDETQEIARAYGANRTPEIYLLNPADMTVLYKGRIDDNTEPGQVKKHDLRDALDALLAGTPEKIEPKITKAFGCTIKWKEG
jgi:peroxiredoxin